MTKAAEDSARDVPPDGARDGTRDLLPPSAGRGAWYALAAVVVLAGLLRFHELGHEGGLWLDEIWTTMNAAGNGVALERLAPGEVLSPSPDFTAIGSRGWWHIWGDAASDVHPPLFYLMLRGWMTVFGGSDLAVRSLGALLSTGALVPMFAAARRTLGVVPALVATGLMAVAAGPVYLGQECRSYSLLTLLTATLIWACVRAVDLGVTWRRAAGIGALLLASAMTHYLFAGAAAGAVAWAAWRSDGSGRWRLAVAAALAAGVFGVAWGPVMLEQRHYWAVGSHLVDLNPTSVAVGVARCLSVPARLLVPSEPIGGSAALCVAAWALVVSPALARRGASGRTRVGGAGVWWFALVGGIGCLAGLDLARHGLAMALPRYTSHLAPATCALVAAALPRRRGAGVGAGVGVGVGWWAAVPVAVVVGTSAWYTWDLAYTDKGRWEEMVGAMSTLVRPGDAILFESPRPADWRPKFQLMCWSRYEGPLRDGPHATLSGPGPLRLDLGSAQRAWVFSTRDVREPLVPVEGWAETTSSPITVFSPEAPASVRLWVRDGAP